MADLALTVGINTVTVTDAMVSAMCRAVRVKETETSTEEVRNLICACCIDLNRQGVVIVDPDEALTRQAVKLYVKAHYGYDRDSEKFLRAYEALSAAMALSGDYQVHDGSDG